MQKLFTIILALGLLVLPFSSLAQMPVEIPSEVATQAASAVVQVSVYREVPVYRMYFSEDSGLYVNMEMRQIGTANKEVSSGSGFFITSDGYLITNKHVVDKTGATYIVTTENSEAPAQVVYRDPEYDLAILKIADGDYPTIKLNSESLDIGDEIIAIGNALGKYINSVSTGTVSALNQNISAQNGDVTEEIDGLIKTSASLYPGDSGGPLLNTEGEAVGVNVATALDLPISFSIPASIAELVINRAGIVIG